MSWTTAMTSTEQNPCLLSPAAVLLRTVTSSFSESQTLKSNITFRSAESNVGRRTKMNSDRRRLRTKTRNLPQPGVQMTKLVSHAGTWSLKHIASLVLIHPVAFLRHQHKQKICIIPLLLCSLALVFITVPSFYCMEMSGLSIIRNLIEEYFHNRRGPNSRCRVKSISELTFCQLYFPYFKEQM